MTDTVLEVKDETAALTALDTLEAKIDGAVKTIEGLRAECAQLKVELTARDDTISKMKSEMENKTVMNDEIVRLEEERDNLLRDRNAVASRIEGILERLDGIRVE